MGHPREILRCAQNDSKEKTGAEGKKHPPFAKGKSPRVGGPNKCAGVKVGAALGMTTKERVPA
jgi:hypothetical protein